MLHTIRRLKDRLRSEDRAASLVEYTLLLALLVFVCIGALTLFGNGSGNSLNNSKSCIEAANAGKPLPPTC